MREVSPGRDLLRVVGQFLVVWLSIIVCQSELAHLELCVCQSSVGYPGISQPFGNGHITSGEGVNKNNYCRFSKNGRNYLRSLYMMYSHHLIRSVESMSCEVGGMELYL